MRREAVPDQRESAAGLELIAGTGERAVELVHTTAQHGVGEGGAVDRGPDEVGTQDGVGEVSTRLRNPPGVAARPSCGMPGGSSVTDDRSAPCSWWSSS